MLESQEGLKLLALNAPRLNPSLNIARISRRVETARPTVAPPRSHMPLETQEGLKRKSPFGLLVSLLLFRLESQEGLKRTARNEGVQLDDVGEPRISRRVETWGLLLCGRPAPRRPESQEGLKSRPGWARIHAGPPGGRISVGTVN
jgi:hypothetical protein